MNGLKNFAPMLLTANPTFHNSIFQKLFEGINSIYLDFVAISFIVAAASAVVVLVVNFLLPGAEPKEGWKKLKTIFIAYIVINSIMGILEFAQAITH